MVSNSLLVAMGEPRRLQVCKAPAWGQRLACHQPPHRHACSKGPGGQQENLQPQCNLPADLQAATAGILFGERESTSQSLGWRPHQEGQVPTLPCMPWAGLHASGVGENDSWVGGTEITGNLAVNAKLVSSTMKPLRCKGQATVPLQWAGPFLRFLGGLHFTAEMRPQLGHAGPCSGWGFPATSAGAARRPSVTTVPSAAALPSRHGGASLSIWRLKGHHSFWERPGTAWWAEAAGARWGKAAARSLVSSWRDPHFTR